MANEAEIRSSASVDLACDGCETVTVLKRYLVTHHDDTTSECLYCDDCAALARCDWNGETKSIRAASLTVDETRRRIAAIPADERCHPSCAGWDIFETNTSRGIEIERCDECFAHLPDDQTVMDDDVEQLPEAIEALARAPHKEN